MILSIKKKSRLDRLIVALLFSVAGAFCISPAHAASIPWNQSYVELAADGEDLLPFLQRFFARVGIPVRASERVGGRVSGRFNDLAETVFSEIADSYGLTWYFDGAVLHIYSIAEIESRLLRLEPSTASRFPGLIEQLEIADARFPISAAAEDGYFTISGPPRYLERVLEVAETLGKALREPVEKKVAVPEQRARPVASQSQAVTARGQAIRVFRLRHAWAADRVIAVGGVQTTITGVANVVQSMMGRPEGNTDSGDSIGPMKVLPVSGRGLLGQGLVTVGREDDRDDQLAGAGLRAGASAGEAGFQEPNTTLRNTGAGAIDGSGVVRADTRINAVIVRDYVENMPLYQQLIRSLDVPTPLIEIEATVIDISTERAESLGVDFSLLLSNRPGITSVPLVGLQTEGLANGTAPRAQVLLGNDKNFLYARINALRETGDATIQSTPRVLTIDNQEAVLTSTQEFFVRVAGRDVADLFNVSTGLTLRVTPSLIPGDGVVRFKLQVRIDDGSIVPTNTVDSIPIVNRSGISASVVVDEGESLFIGGLTSEQAISGQRGVPGLSKIPVLGALFRTDSSQMRKVQRMFLLTPKLIKGAG